MLERFDDFDLGPQSDEDFNSDERFGTEDADIEEPFDRDGWDDQAALDSVYGADDDWASQYDDDPSPYGGTYSEE